MSSFDDLIKKFNEKAKGCDNMQLAMLVMEFSKNIEENYTKQEKDIFLEHLMSKMSTENLEKAKKYAQLLKN